MAANTDSKPVSILDINPLQHLTTDAAISQYNYESIMNGLVQWDQSRLDNITIRLAIRTEPYFVDYILHTKYYYDKTYGSTASETLLANGRFAYDHRLNYVLATDDLATLRVNVVDNGGTSWQLYQIVHVADAFKKVKMYEDNDGELVDEEHLLDDTQYTLVANMYHIIPFAPADPNDANSEAEQFPHSYISGAYFRIYDTSSDTFKIYKVLDGHTVTSPDDIAANAVLVCQEGTSAYPPTAIPTFDIYVNNASTVEKTYIHSPNKNIDTGKKMSTPASGYELYCNNYVSGKYDGNKIVKGTLVYYRGDFFIALKDAPATAPFVSDAENDYVTFMADDWARVFAIPFNNAVIEGSGTIRTTVKTDVDGYILRNVGVVESNEKTNIAVTATFSTEGEPTSQPTGMNILQSSNYVNWPEQTSKWTEGTMYTTDPSFSAYCKQNYSAVMMFDHTDTDNFKYKNIINYDGPDLDQGLCVMLPVSVLDENNVSHDPEDGTMIEFLFNIWPNHKYDGRAANDLIINKSQIYVYSVPSLAEYKVSGFNIGTVEPIAKFSMARLVNFYMFSENVGVPDRPVCYKARFIYSAKEKRWKTYDYYQLPDHIFLSPNGFVDPSQPEAYGVQTAGFPLYQNPFSDFNLSAIHVNQKFKNQIQKPGE